MWQVGKRKLPEKLIIDGGSDWFCLNSEFIDYVLNSQDDFVIHLKNFFNYTLLPSEVSPLLSHFFIKSFLKVTKLMLISYLKSFFHTVAINSRFCDKILNSNLRFVNWNRDRGCQCQYNHLVDCKLTCPKSYERCSKPNTLVLILRVRL